MSRRNAEKKQMPKSFKNAWDINEIWLLRALLVDLLGASWPSWRPLGGFLGRLRPSGGHLRPSWMQIGLFGMHLGAMLSVLEAILGVLEAFGPSWGPHRAFLGASWAVMGPPGMGGLCGDLGAISGASRAAPSRR
eukprot:121894-Pyramimonas_sp.AAC.1